MNIASFTHLFSSLKISAPSIHTVLGSGLAHLIDDKFLDQFSNIKLKGELCFSDIPEIPATTVEGHSGRYLFFENTQSNKIFCIQTGRIHGYEGHHPRVVTLPVTLIADLGCQKFILSNAAGSLRENIKPGSVMIIKDHVNMTGLNPLTGTNPKDSNQKYLGPRFPDMSKAYNEEINFSLAQHFKNEQVPTDRGVYLGLMGPSFETPAEVALFARWGLDAVGMSTVWENISLTHRGCQVGGFSFISNLGCGLSDTPLSHEEVKECAEEFGFKIIKAVFEYLNKATSA